MSPRIDYLENELHIEHFTQSEKVYINFRHNGRLHIMERENDESLQKTLIRIGRNFVVKNKKSKKKRSSSGALLKSIALYNSDGNVVEDLSELTNRDWKDNMKVKINDNVELIVAVNPPVALSVSVFPKKLARVNNYLVPHVVTKYCTEMEFLWCAKGDIPLSGEVLCQDTEYHIVSQEDIFCPRDYLSGCSIKLFCTPFRTVDVSSECSSKKIFGRSVVYYLSKHLLPEESLPKALEYRSDFALQRLPSVHRLTTFNILSQAYTQNSHALRCLYDYLENPDFHLNEEYRLQLVVKELLAYRCDIMCLQEVDESAYEKYLRPIFAKMGYASHLTCKDGGKTEGCATFASTSSYDMLTTFDLSLQEIFRNGQHSTNYYLNELFKAKPQILKDFTENITTVAQVSLLRCVSDPSQILLVANTHLFYHPDADYIRLLQMREIVNYLEQLKSSILLLDLNLKGANIIEEIEKCTKCSTLSSTKSSESSNITDKTDKFRVACFVFGDLNSCPSTGAIKFLESGEISASHETWKSTEVFEWNKERESQSSRGADCSGLFRSFPHLSHGLNLQSAAGFPKFSNYTKDFKELLDYIFVEQDKCSVVAVAPFPPEEILSEDTAIPSKVFPSDHVSVVVDIRLKESSDIEDLENKMSHFQL